MQYIASLPSEASSASADTHIQGENNHSRKIHLESLSLCRALDYRIAALSHLKGFNPGRRNIVLAVSNALAPKHQRVINRTACRLSFCIVCLAEPENGDAGSSGPQSSAQDLAGVDLDVRERIYEMVRPLDWMEEAPEPPGAPSEVPRAAIEKLPILKVDIILILS